MRKFILFPLILCMTGLDAIAADTPNARAAAATNRANTLGGAGVARMPTVSTISIGTMGNITTNPNTGAMSGPGVSTNTPGINVGGNNGGNGGGTGPVINPPNPNPEPECTVEVSEYTVQNCMDDVYSCVTNGALPAGLNDLFDENTRNTIYNNSNICFAQVERCVRDVQTNCKSVYGNSAAVWNDFNSRRVMPNYFEFVLRKTGLSPNQAQHTCLMIDQSKHTGSSFDAKSDDSVGNPAVANWENPLANYTDSTRGEFARWDAKNGECLVRVAAYNTRTDEVIRKNILWGSGDDKETAEVWLPFGETFTCGKELFDFNLRRNTQNIAMIGGGATVLGAGTAAAFSHGKRDFDCDNASGRKQLLEELRESGRLNTINSFITTSGTTGAITLTGDFNKAQCELITGLYDRYIMSSGALAECADVDNIARSGGNVDMTSYEYISTTTTITDTDGNTTSSSSSESSGGTTMATTQTDEKIANLQKICSMMRSLSAMWTNTSGPLCSSGGECVPRSVVEGQVRMLSSAFDSLPVLQGERGTRLKNAAIATGIGAGATGLATLITSQLEKNNIMCHVGNKLESVGLNKSHRIGTLRDFYVKWNIRMPERIMPTSIISDCTGIENACKTYQQDPEQCRKAAVNFKDATMKTPTIIEGACRLIGSDCFINDTLSAVKDVCDIE